MHRKGVTHRGDLKGHTQLGVGGSRGDSFVRVTLGPGGVRGVNVQNPFLPVRNSLEGKPHSTSRFGAEMLQVARLRRARQPGPPGVPMPPLQRSKFPCSPLQGSKGNLCPFVPWSPKTLDIKGRVPIILHFIEIILSHRNVPRNERNASTARTECPGTNPAPAVSVPCLPLASCTKSGPPRSKPSPCAPPAAQRTKRGPNRPFLR